jgi:hypothetical protein
MRNSNRQTEKVLRDLAGQSWRGEGRYSRIHTERKVTYPSAWKAGIDLAQCMERKSSRDADSQM